MSKIDSLKKCLKIGGLEGLVRLVKRYIDTHCRRGLMRDWPLKSRINADMVTFGEFYGYYFDLYNPHSFTEKIHTYKLLYNDPLMSDIVDKYNFKDYVRNRLGSDKYVAKAYGIFDSIQQVEDIWDTLPNEFVLKSTICGDGNNIIFVEDKKSTPFNKIKEDVERCFNPQNTLLNSFARAYYPLRPRLLVEEYIRELSGGLQDYKFYCFNGDVEFVYTTSRLFDSKENPSETDYPRTFFDLEWKKIPITLGDHPTADGLCKPKHFEDMVKIARELSKGFPFVRIDFYDKEENPLLGEMTFYPTGGWKPLKPFDFDRKLGDKFILPPQKFIKN